MRLGHFDNPATQPFAAITPAAICTADAKALALSAATQGLVLVKNAGRALPLAAAAVPRLAVVGPLATATTALQGGYSGAPCGGAIDSLLTRVQRYVPGARYTAGCALNSSDASGIAAAAAAAAVSDAVLIAVGLDDSLEGETHDRLDIGFPGVQAQLIAAVAAAAAPKPVVVVVYGGGAIDISAALANPNLSAVLIGGYPGQAGGEPVAVAVFGATAPAGRLTQTYYYANFTKTVRV